MKGGSFLRQRKTRHIIPRSDVNETRKRKIHDAARYLRLLLKLLSGALLLVFAWLKLQQIPVLRVVRSAEAHALLQLSMVLYFSSWVAGSNFDISLREDTYISPPTDRSLRLLLPLYAVLAFVFGLLCWFVNTSTQFAFFLLLFWGVNALGWLGARRGLFPSVFAGAKDESSAVRRAVLAAVRRYEMGDWQTYRFLSGGILIAAINAATLTKVNTFLVRHPLLAWPPDLFFAACILAFVVLLEAWMWWERARIHHAVVTIRWLSELYEIGPERP